MPVANIFGTDDEAPRRRRQTPAQMMGEVLLRQGSSSEPTNSKLVGAGRIATGAIGGYMAGLEAKRQEEAEAAGAKAMGALLLGGSGGAAAPGGTFNPSGATPAFAGGKTAMRMPADADVEKRFVGTLRDGGLTNPNGLAAFAAYANAESGYSPKNITGSWSDPSQSGQPGTSGGILSWRGPRLAAMQAATAGAPDPVVAQAKFALTENPQLTAALQNARSPEEAHSLLANAWKFAGFDKSGGESQRRLDMTRSYLDRVGQPAQTADAGTGGDPNVGAPLPPERPDFASMPAPGATPTALSIAMPGDPGFVIPGEDGQIVPLQPGGMMPGASGPDAAPARGPSLDALAQITGGGYRPAGDAPLRGTIDPGQPDGATPLPEVNVAGSAPPLPPPRPQDLGAILSGQSAPIPPARPNPADMPAPNAQPAMLTDAQQIGRLLQARGGMPDLSNADSGGAREFTASQADPRALGAVVANFRPGQGGTSGSPDAIALGRTLLGQPAAPPVSAPSAAAQMAPAPGPQSAGAPQSIMPAGVSGGPSPGASGPVATPASGPGGIGGMSPQMLAGVNALANSPNPAHQAIARTMIEKALEGTKASFHDNGDETLIANQQGQIIGRLPKAKAADFGVVGKDAYGQDVYGYRNYGDRSVTRPDVPGSAGAQPPVDMKGNPIPTGVDPKAVREAESKSYAGGLVPADGAATAEVRKEVLSLPSYKNVQQARPVYKAMVEAAGRDTKAADLNIVYGLGKIMDPGSVVREGEIQMANDTQGYGDKLNGFIKSIQGEGRLRPEVRAQLLAEAHGRMQAYESEFNVDGDHYRGGAKRNRMNPDDVVPTFEPSKPWSPPAKAMPGQPGSSSGPAPTAPATKTINGRTFTRGADGSWYAN